jgi:hypothetical protein
VALLTLPLPADLPAWLAELSGEDWNRETLARHGWHELDDIRFENGTGHWLYPSVPDADDFGGFFLPFGLYAEDEEDDSFEDLPWRPGDRDGRPAFDAVWREAVAFAASALGEPAFTAKDPDPEFPWHYAAWRRGDVVVAITQVDDIVNQSDAEIAAVWVRRHPSTEELPGAEEFADWLTSG